MPSTDFSSDQKSPGGYGGSYSSGVGSNSYGGGSESGSRYATYGGGGITTGNTIYGNTAFGVPGQMATGYATATGLPGVAYGPTPVQYSNFMNLNGTPMFGGAFGGQSFTGNTANEVYARLQQLYSQMFKAPQPAAAQTGGLLDAIQTAPLPPIPQMVPSYYDAYRFFSNPTQRPYDATQSKAEFINTPGAIKTVTQSPGLKDSLPAGVNY